MAGALGLNSEAAMVVVVVGWRRSAVVVAAGWDFSSEHERACLDKMWDCHGWSTFDHSSAETGLSWD